MIYLLYVDSNYIYSEIIHINIYLLPSQSNGNILIYKIYVSITIIQWNQLRFFWLVVYVTYHISSLLCLNNPKHHWKILFPYTLNFKLKFKNYNTKIFTSKNQQQLIPWTYANQLHIRPKNLWFWIIYREFINSRINDALGWIGFHGGALIWHLHHEILHKLVDVTQFDKNFMLSYIKKTDGCKRNWTTCSYKLF